MGEAVSISVVVPVHDESTLLRRQVRALLGQQASWPWELVIVDNRSGPEHRRSIGSVVDEDERIRVVIADAHPGAGYARNVGADVARSERLAFCDADDVVAPGWLAAIVDGLERHPFVTGPLELDALNPPWIAGSRGRAFFDAAPTYRDRFLLASSCNLGIRREVFESVGGFDESLLRGQDLDLSFRLWRRGHTGGFALDAVVHFQYRSSLSALARQGFLSGRYQPEIDRRLRAAGLPVPSARTCARRSVWLVRHLLAVADAAGRARWTWVASTTSGELVGLVDRARRRRSAPRGSDRAPAARG